MLMWLGNPTVAVHTELFQQQTEKAAVYIFQLTDRFVRVGI
jgi:hypothetical protein